MRTGLLILIIGVCTSTAVSAQSCTAVGKFVTDLSCTGYITCLDPANDTVYPFYPVNCPTNFHVRLTDMVCVKATDVCDPTFTCTDLGNFPNPSSTSTSSYIACIQGFGTLKIAAVMTCPTDSTFNSQSAQCEQIITTTDTQIVSTTAAVAGTAVESTVGTTSAPASAATAVTSPAAVDTTETVSTVITTTTLKIPTHRANSAAHIYSSYVVILTAVISVGFYE